MGSMSIASKGWGKEERKDIFNFIVRAVNLKDEALQQKFIQDIHDFQGDDTMAQLTFVEKYFRDKGHNEGLNEGIAIGEERGRREANFETARRLRNAGISDKDIHTFTNLSFDEISSL